MSWLRIWVNRLSLLRPWKVVFLVALVMGGALSIPAAPGPITLVIQPKDQVVDSGQRAIFTVTATAHAGRLRYQWFCRPGGRRLLAGRRCSPEFAIPGATAASYTTPALSLRQNGWEYCVLLLDGRAWLESRNALLTVKPGPEPGRPMAELALPLSVHPGDTWMKASVPVQSDMTYLWMALPGTSSAHITAGQGTGVITFSASPHLGTFQILADVQNREWEYVNAARTVTVQRGTWLVENGGPSVPRAGATATLLPSGRVLVAGGGLPGNGSTLASAEIYDPATGTWTQTGCLGTPRGLHSATLLPDGNVLVAGGIAAPGVALASAELYDPAKGTWTPAGDMGTARIDHTATLLPNGTVLVAGGDPAYSYKGYATAEIFDPVKRTWAPATPMGTARHSHTATLLPDGTVLVAGGEDAQDGVHSSAEIYTPSNGTWTVTGSPGQARGSHTATLLLDGRVLVVGGGVPNGAGSVASAEIYDPAQGTWAATGRLGTARGGQTATLLPDGRVLVAGGDVPNNQALASTEIYDPTKGTWAASHNLGTARYLHTATLLRDGTILVAGGTGSNYSMLARPEIYSPSHGTWSTTLSLGTARSRHTATLLPNGTVLVTGGVGTSAELSSTEIYHPATRTWTPTGSLGTARGFHSATLLPDGTVLVTGGAGTSAEIYNPAKGTWTPTASMNQARDGHSATLLPDGTVLVAGGFAFIGEMVALTSAEIYDPAKGTWTPTGSLVSGRARHTATLLKDGTVLVAGGAMITNPFTALATAEIYDPAKGTWTATAAMGTARAEHTATLLANGMVLAAGGDTYAETYGLNKAELYCPKTRTWTAVADLGTARASHTATLLPGGTVVVAGGMGAGAAQGYLASTEIFTPKTGTWSATGSLETARQGHSATLLEDGTILVAFGDGADVVTEIYMP